MKKIAIVLSLIICGLNQSYSQSVGISDQAGQSISASAVLDLQSTTKGLLTPRMDSTTRKAISSPAEGLLVYDTNTKSFWFYGKKDDKTTGSWRELQNGSISAKDKVTIENDGTLRFDGASTVYGDLIVSPDATNRGGSNAPVWGGAGSTFFLNNGAGSQGVFLWMFSATIEQELYFTVQLPHTYKEGTDIYPHIHWTTKTGTPTGTDVVWGLEYTWVALGGNFANTSNLTANSIVAGVTASGTGQHLITSLGTISGTGMKISSIIICRIYRAATSGSDTFANETGLLSIDFHYEIDTNGSRSLYAK